MNNQPGNQEHLKPSTTSSPITKLGRSSYKSDGNKSYETPSASTAKSDTENEKIQFPPTILQISTVLPKLSEEDQLQMSNVTSKNDVINEEILIKAIAETTEQRGIKIPLQLETSGPNSKPETVGDDSSKKNEVHIVCECEPSVAGAAVPIVKSFIPSEKKNSIVRCNKSSCSLSNNNLIKDVSNSEKHKLQYKQETSPACIKNIEPSKANPNIVQKPKDSEKNDTDGLNKKYKCSQRYLRGAAENSSSEVKSNLKKPSLIPKPTRPITSSGKNLDPIKDATEKRQDNRSPNRNSVKCFTKCRVETSKLKETKTSHHNKNNPTVIITPLEKHSEKQEASTNVNTISSRMLGLQERLKATTSMLRQKIELDKSKENIVFEGSDTDVSAEEEANKNIPAHAGEKTIDDLYKSIYSLKNITSDLSENNTLKSQENCIEKLFRNISQIKLIADKLCMNDQLKSKQEVSDDSNESITVEKEKSRKSSATNTKDNKIYIKFMHTRDKKIENKKKKKELSPEGSEEVQTDLALGSKLTSDSITSDMCVTEKNQEENKIKEADSMDGVFIPTCEPPINMEEEEEPNGLDITITFPEFSQFYSNGTESHLSLCLSEISAEALKKLKRCPKDFTLRMDFVEGKVLFQSGKGPANNFQIGPDLKLAENIVDTKKSDVISIKPSTECSFGSQMIPVENPREIKSFKSLKSTDSELFNVVSLPFLYKNPLLATSHKSCITFRNEQQLMSMAIIARHIFKSMPQIPSLTNIFEDKIMESPSKTGSREKTQKSPESKEIER